MPDLQTILDALYDPPFAFGEVRLWLALLLIAALGIRFWPKTWRYFWQRLAVLSRHRSRTVAAIFFLSLALRLAAWPWVGAPTPIFQDEFSYKLGADTFAHFRLMNPTPPGWQFFETFHTNLVPTYQSMYPPASFVPLALSQLLTGSTVAGLALAIALMCAAITWMLQACMPSRWALLGGVIAALQFSIAHDWAHDYMNGTAAVTGGCL